MPIFKKMPFSQKWPIFKNALFSLGLNSSLRNTAWEEQWTHWHEVVWSGGAHPHGAIKVVAQLVASLEISLWNHGTVVVDFVVKPRHHRRCVPLTGLRHRHHYQGGDKVRRTFLLRNLYVAQQPQPLLVEFHFIFALTNAVDAICLPYEPYCSIENVKFWTGKTIFNLLLADNADAQ